MENSTLTYFLSSISPIAAVAAAVAAWKAAKASSKGVEAQILIQLRSEFSSQPMHDAMVLLSDFRKYNQSDFDKKFIGLKNSDREKFNQLNNARRLIKGYYSKVYHLNKSKVINKKIVKSLISEVQFDLMLETLEPLERVISVKENYDRLLFDWARKIS